MKIAISSSGNRLDAQLDPRFGRCAYLLIVDPADMRYEVFDNQSAAQSSGAGIQAAQFLADKNVSAVITGHVGPNAVETLAAAGIDIFAEQQGSIKEVVNRFKSGALSPTSQPTVGGHFGMGGRAGTGSRRGQRQGSVAGGGMGQGVGRGMRQGKSRDMRPGAGRGMGRGGGMRRS